MVASCLSSVKMTAPGVTGLATGVFILVLSQVISSVAAETAKLNGTCDGSVKTLANGCSISSDCSTIKCEMKFVEMPIIFKLKVNKCGDKVSATTTVEVPDLHITWSHVYTSNEIVQVPGFTTSFHGIIDTGVFVQVELSPIDDKLHVTARVLAGTKVLGKGDFPVKVTVIEGDLRFQCGKYKSLYRPLNCLLAR
ncbi:uncharacterized protein LOC144664439 [Oculina patagonica]